MKNPIDALIAALTDEVICGTWSDIEETFLRLRIPWREDLEPGWGKPKYVGKVLADLEHDEVQALGRRFLEHFDSVSVQNALWSLESGGECSILPVTRKAAATALEGLVPSREMTDALDSHASRSPDSLYFDYFIGQDAEEIPASYHDLLLQRRYLDWPDKRFKALLADLVSPMVDRKQRLDRVRAINGALASASIELARVGSVAGEPTFDFRNLNSCGVSGLPKNIIFASVGEKPELGFADAINNDVVILSQRESCLICDEPIDSDMGVQWNDLVAWWSRRCPMNDDPRKSLGGRLMKSLASPPEKSSFKSYFRTFIPLLNERLPALIPQVYLHYDPVTVRSLYERGEDKRFASQRMDFLMLLKRNVRVVIEVDGQQHYATDIGPRARPSPRTYATTVSGDRDLRLTGYEVYRFAGYELKEQQAGAVVKDFFLRLFERHGIS